jgi:hypothetical protein
MNKEVRRPPLLIKSESITVVTEEGPRIVRRDQVNFEPLREAIREQQWEKVLELANPVVAIRNFVGLNDTIEIVGDQILFNGQALHGYLVNKILGFMRSGLSVDHLLEFLKNLQSNPSMRAREELYKFLETEDLPVTEDGHFLAYKAVRSNWMDKHSGKINNSVGCVIAMPRANVDDNQEVGCSKGLHAGSLSYVSGFGNERCGDIFLIVKINPADVVCIPREDCRKLRCCRYEVVGTMKGELVYHAYGSDGVTPLGSSRCNTACGHDHKDVDVDKDWDWDDDDEFDYGLDNNY